MSLRSERLVVLLSKEEKARLAKLAERKRLSMGELARSALIQLDGFRLESHSRGQGLSDRPGDWADDVQISSEQAATLDRLADATLRTLTRANQALEKAFEEVETTKAYFAQKRAVAKTAAEAEAEAEA